MTSDNNRQTDPLYDAIDWAALKPGDPDPEPTADGVACNVFVRHPASGAQFDCTRSPHDEASDPRHVSCAYWGSMTAADAVVVAIWDAGPDTRTVAVESLGAERFAEIAARFPE